MAFPNDGFNAPTPQQRRSKKIGLPPGSLVYVGDAPDFEPYVEHYAFDTQQAISHSYGAPTDVRSDLNAEHTHWITVYGVHEPGVVEHMGQVFQLHHLLLEDILNTTQRPTAELYDDTLFASMKMVAWDAHRNRFTEEHISMVLKGNTVLLFQERPGDVLDDIRQRIETGKGVLRARGADYLFYRILDAVVDQYYLIGEQLNDLIEKLENDILVKPRQAQMRQLLMYKKMLLNLRTIAAPLRDHVALTERLDRSIVKKETLPYLRDLNAHVKEVLEIIDVAREAVNGLIDLYLSASNQQMNQVIRLLTVISTIFIPLTFIVGVYGMNFKMPEYDSTYGYPAVWGVMVTVAIVLLIVFRRKRWI